MPNDPDNTLVMRPGPPNVPSTLSGHAAKIWSSAFQAAYSGTCKSGGKQGNRDACAASIAWGAVKNSYKKGKDGNWVAKTEAELRADDPTTLPLPPGDAAELDAQFPMPMVQERPVIPTPDNLTDAEKEIWNRNYMDAISGECGMADSPQACSAATAWQAVREQRQLAEAPPSDQETEADQQATDEENPEDQPKGQDQPEDQQAADQQGKDQQATDQESAGKQPDQENPEEDQAPDEESPEDQQQQDQQVEDKRPASEQNPNSQSDEENQQEDQAPDEESPEDKKKRKGKKVYSKNFKSLLIGRKDYSDKKRAEYAKKGWALPDGSFPIADCGDLEDAVRSFGRHKGSDKRVINHIKKRARALGCTNLIPQEWGGGSKEKADHMVKSKVYTPEERSTFAKAGVALPDGSLVIVSKSDVESAMEAFSEAGVNDPKAIRHIIIRSGVLGALTDLPDTWINKGTALGISKVDASWLDKTVKRVVDGISDQDWLDQVGPATEIKRPDYFSSNAWAATPAVERTARAEFMRRLVSRKYEQAADDLRVQGWESRPAMGKPTEFEFRRWVSTDQGPLLQRAVLVRNLGSTDWHLREMSRGASMSSAVHLPAGETRL